MSTIELSNVSGRIVGYELLDDNEAILKIKDDKGKVVETTTALQEGAAIPSGIVRIVTTIEFAGGASAAVVKDKLPNVLFGRNGHILISPTTKEPFPGRPGPKGRGTEQAPLDKVEKAAGGRATSTMALQWKMEYQKYLDSGKGFKEWNHDHASTKLEKQG